MLATKAGVEFSATDGQSVLVEKTPGVLLKLTRSSLGGKEEGSTFIVERYPSSGKNVQVTAQDGDGTQFNVNLLDFFGVTATSTPPETKATPPETL